MSGTRFKDDPRNSLYKEFLRILNEIKPYYFVMENVMGILTYKNQIKEDMEHLKYDVEVQIIKGEEIGMRQKRHRVFFIGQCLEEIA
jgi:DNA (cytosine-5)-methyltransferase 1